jgi:hypothetical protein
VERDGELRSIQSSSRNLELMFISNHVELIKLRTQLDVYIEKEKHQWKLEQSLRAAMTDLRRLTSSRRYRMSRKIRLALVWLTHRGTQRHARKNDVLPIEVDVELYLEFLRTIDVNEQQFKSALSHVTTFGINPFTYHVRSLKKL